MRTHFLITIVISAFLLFVVQPMYARILLPQYGGGSAVWTACMVFFQSFLLIGYSYAHGLVRWCPMKHQKRVHLIISLFVGLSYLLIGALRSDIVSAVQEGSDPFVAIFGELLTTVGLPYWLLSTTAPLLQFWYSQQSLSDDKSSDVYRLYSASNVGAFVALFSYPLLIEYRLSLSEQSAFWLGGFVGFVVVLAWLITRLSQDKGGADESIPKPEKDGVDSPTNFVFESMRWLGFAALGVVLLISITSNLTHNVPPIPLLWTVPLALYLLSYILTFRFPAFYQRVYWNVLFVVLAVIGLFLFYIGSQFSLVSQVVLYLLLLFVGCVICHGELYLSRPAPDRLTSFYLILALGGVVGSLFTSFVATSLFNQYYELFVALVGIMILVGLSKNVGWLTRSSLVVVSSLYVIATWTIDNQFNRFNIYQDRNFYGTVTVKDIELEGRVERRLIDGYTAHGNQVISDSQLKPLPQSYYRLETGIGQWLSSEWNVGTSRRIAFVGLGVGALAYYGKAGDQYRFYELNPQVKDAAYKYFDFLTTSSAQVDVVLGDARIQLSRELHKSDVNKFDLVVIDAFSSDAIPVHLITQEAMQLYLDLLNEHGVLAFHISNTYLDLRPVLAQAATDFNLASSYVHTPADQRHPYASDWVFLSRSKTDLDLYLADSYNLRETTETEGVRWTDDFSSILQVLK